MKNLQALKRMVLTIVVLMGSFPSLVTLFSKSEGPFQLVDSPYWKAILIAAVSIFTVILVSRYFSTFFFKKWMKEHLVIGKKALLTGLIVFISGIIAVIVGWELNWITAGLLAASGVTQIEWYKFIYTVPLFAFIYSVLPVLGISVLIATFSYFFLKPEKN